MEDFDLASSRFLEYNCCLEQLHNDYDCGHQDDDIIIVDSAFVVYCLFGNQVFDLIPGVLCIREQVSYSLGICRIVVDKQGFGWL